MKALITGANGMLGTALQKVLLETGYKIHPTDISANLNPEMIFLDVCNYNQAEKTILRSKPDIVFHLAAETNVDKCESEINHAYQTNTIGTENIALICQRLDVIMVYISTAGVFDGGKETAYTEFDKPNPLNVYSKTKLEGEKVVRNLLKRYYIIRAGWMIGGGSKDKKFVGKILNLLKVKKELQVVNDKFGSPTFTQDLSNCAVKLIKADRFGLYHMANKGSCSRYQIACKIVKILGLDNVKIIPVTSDVFPLPAPRGRSEAIRNYKLDLLEMNTMPTWEDALKRYIEGIAADTWR